MKKFRFFKPEFDTLIQMRGFKMILFDCKNSKLIILIIIVR